MLNVAYQWIQSITGISIATQNKIFSSAIIILVLLVLRTILLKIVFKQTTNAHTRYVWRKTSSYVAVILAIFVGGRVWIAAFASIGTFLGLLSAGIAIALKDLLVNIAGWLYIISFRPFVVGDRIQIGDNSGDVIDISVFGSTLLEIRKWVDADQSTGRILVIPNGQLLTLSLANYTKGLPYIWNEIPILITFESDWKKAKKMFLEILVKHAKPISKYADLRLDEASKKFMISYKKLTPIIYTTVKNSGVLLTMRFLCEPKSRRSVEMEIWEDILDQLSKCDDIDLAYPTQRFYNNAIGGKEKHKQSPDGLKDMGT